MVDFLQGGCGFHCGGRFAVIFFGGFFENKNPVTSKQGKTRPISQKNITAKKQTLQKTSLRRKTPLCRKTNNAEKNNTVGFFQFGFCWRILVLLL